MSLIQKCTGLALKRLPKAISPTQHAIIDYAVAAAFFAAGAAWWGRNRRAAISSIICGGAVATSSLITDYPGGVLRLISLKTHAEVDAGLAGMTAALPGLVGLAGKRERRFFDIQATLETAAAALTDFRRDEHPHPRVSRRRAA